MKLWMWMMIGWIVGIIVGFGISWFMAWRHDKKLCVGTLRVDRSDPDEAPYLFLELKQDEMDKIHKSKIMIFNVDLNGYLPRK